MPCRAFFALWGVFFLWARVLYAVFVFVRCVAFLAALRRCFFVCFASLFPFSRCDMPVEAQILLVTAFCGVGGILYRVIFPWLVGGLFWL